MKLRRKLAEGRPFDRNLVREVLPTSARERWTEEEEREALVGESS